MSGLDRRRFLATSAMVATSTVTADLGLLAELSRVSAADPRVVPEQVRLSPTIEELIRLIKTTPRERCVAVFVAEIRRGLSYQEFLTSLFLAAIEHGDPHQVAQVYSAHRLGSEARVEERLLPMFWALDRVKSGFDEPEAGKGNQRQLGRMPPAERALGVFREAMEKLDPDAAERAIVVVARTQGARFAMSQLWRHGARRVSGTLGHHPIVLANGWRTLEAMGWQHAEPVLRYLARYFPNFDADRTYEPNLERVAKALPVLPADWASGEPERQATLDVYALLRKGDADAASNLIVSQLTSGRVKAGAVWDAVHLVAADLLVRYKTGGGPIGGMLIHAVTSTNALRYGFQSTSDDRARLLMLLQSVGALGDVFIGPAERDGQLRELNLLELAKSERVEGTAIDDVFSLLPYKTVEYYKQNSAEERAASDEACRKAFALLREGANFRPFMKAARSLVCAKASPDPHDVKYPVAAFEDVSLASAEWRPFLLASSVHALHGTRSADAAAVVRAREALR